MKSIQFKKWLVIITISFLIILNACDPPIIFTQPQPEGGTDLKKFPAKLQGHYLNLEDSSIITINKTMLIWEWFSRVTIPKHEVDTSSNYIFKDNILFQRCGSIKMNAQLINDTIVAILHNIDTVFQISSDNILRRYKGHLLLNLKYEEGWEVDILSYSKDKKLSWKSITMSDELEKLQKITAVEEITDENNQVIQYNINPTRQELKNILVPDMFNNEIATFIKIELK